MASESAPSVPVCLSVRLHSPHQCKRLVPAPLPPACLVHLCFCRPCLLCARGLLKFWPERFSFRMSHFAAGSHKITGASWRDHLSGAPPRASRGLGGSVWSLVLVGTEQPSPALQGAALWSVGRDSAFPAPPTGCLKKQ